MQIICLYCTTPLQQPAHGRKRKFCDDVCKVSYHRLNNRTSISPKETMVNDRCHVCGKKTGNILGDVERATGTLYGYLCAKCYGISRECTDSTRLRNIANYLDRTRPPRSFNNEMKRNSFEKHTAEMKRNSR
jgi:hypothetical protein